MNGVLAFCQRLWERLCAWLAGSDYRRDESRLLPGIDAVTQAPLPASAQLLVSGIFAFFVVALLWACLSKIDIVSAAQGKAIPSSRVKLIQSQQLARVQKIYVEEGDHVQAGQPLLLLDHTQAHSEWRDTQEQLQHLHASRLRLQALIQIAQTPSEASIDFEVPEDANADVWLRQQTLLQDQWRQYRAEHAALQIIMQRKNAAVARIAANIERLQTLLPYSRKKVKRLSQLQSQGSVALDTLEQAREELVERQSALKLAWHEQQEVQAEYKQAEQDLQVFQDRFISEHMQELAQLENELSGYMERAVRAEATLAQYTLSAPVEGTVMEIAANVRSVVQPAELLMRIVPHNVPLEVEIKILNRDIGFVHEEQAVKIKVDTFNFTKYGALEGRITHLAKDAVEDEQLGYVYQALVELQNDSFLIGGRPARLVPGMTVTADIHVGERRLIEYILNPVLRYRDEMLRER